MPIAADYPFLDVLLTAGGPATEIAEAEERVDAEAITREGLDALKTKALS